MLLRDHRWLRRYTWIFAVTGAVLLLLPLLPGLGDERNGSRIWISIGGNSFQPAELAKIACAVFFAGYLVSRRDTDRKSTRLNSSHVAISYAVFCLKKKNKSI